MKRWVNSSETSTQKKSLSELITRILVPKEHPGSASLALQGGVSPHSVSDVLGNSWMNTPVPGAGPTSWVIICHSGGTYLLPQINLSPTTGRGYCYPYYAVFIKMERNSGLSLKHCTLNIIYSCSLSFSDSITSPYNIVQPIPPFTIIPAISNVLIPFIPTKQQDPDNTNPPTPSHHLQRHASIVNMNINPPIP